MKTFSEISNLDFQIIVSEEDINEPTISYRDPDRPSCLVGPLAAVPVGCTVDDDEGNEALDLSGEDGVILAAIACLPQVARLFDWIDARQEELGECSDYNVNRFLDGLKNRVDWIRECIDERPELMNVGRHGFDSF